MGDIHIGHMTVKMYQPGFLFVLGTLLLVAVCEGQSNACNKSECPDYLFSHYEGKGCTPVFSADDHNENCCPTHYNCSAFLAPHDEHSCSYKGKSYSQGDAIETTNPCHKCSCGPNPSINCAITDCFQERPDPSCVPLFDHNSCCPKSFKCVKEDEPAVGVTCKHDEKTFVEGQIMIMKDNPCMQCICDSNFKGPGTGSCRKLECNFPGHGQRLRAGCIPVYFEGQCCYVDWHCPPPFDEEKVPEVNRAETCVFGGLTFKKGQRLELGDPCVNCTCSTPPDLSCVRRRCPGPPADADHSRCQPVPREGQCCPEFICDNQQQQQQQQQPSE
ncbi:hypothetical protein CHUAL_006661 [Chamberlinius hualienensis]